MHASSLWQRFGKIGLGTLCIGILVVAPSARAVEVQVVSPIERSFRSPSFGVSPRQFTDLFVANLGQESVRIEAHIFRSDGTRAAGLDLDAMAQSISSASLGLPIAGKSSEDFQIQLTAVISAPKCHESSEDSFSQVMIYVELGISIFGLGDTDARACRLLIGNKYEADRLQWAEC